MGTENDMVTTVVGLPRLSDGELEQLGRLNPGWAFERDDEGRTVMSPTSSRGGAKSAAALKQLILWQERTGVGGVVFDSSTGFKMSTGAVRSPDASWISQDRIDALGDQANETFWPLCPNVAVEVRSPSETWQYVLEKVRTYMREGAGYAVAIDPVNRRHAVLGEPPTGLAIDFDAVADA
jgi:Uma2 family endonuclease